MLKQLNEPKNGCALAFFAALLFWTTLLIILI